MHLFVERRGKRQSVPTRAASAGDGVAERPLPTRSAKGLQASAAVACLLLSTISQPVMAQQTAPPPPNAPAAQLVIPASPEASAEALVDLRPTMRDFRKERGYWKNPFYPYEPTTVDAARTDNSPKLDSLVRDGKIYLSLSDAVLLAIENNFDIAIQRYTLDIADTDILRTKSGSLLLGVNSGLVTNTIGNTNLLLQSSGGGPGGTSAGSSAGASGLALTTNGGGPLPPNYDPIITGTIQLERATTPQTSSFSGSSITQNTDEYNFGYNQGFLTGATLTGTFNNNRITTNAPFTNYSPALNSNFRATLTQPLLQGFGTGVNGRFIVQARNDRKIADSAFRQQILYTINQVENIYWGLVSAYEDVQSKQRALQQSRQLASDNRKQLEIGTLAPLDVVQSDSNVASDQQALVSSQSALEYQQLVMKQAIARNLNDPVLSAAPVIPTDRVSIEETPEEQASVDDLVKQASANRPEVQQQVLTLKNAEITLKGVKNGLLPIVNVYGFYGAAGVGGERGPNCTILDPTTFQSVPCTATSNPTINYGNVFQSLFNNSGPDRGAGLSLDIPIRNRAAQAEQARAVLEYRQNQMRLQQIFVQIRMQVINGQFALTNDRAQVQASESAQNYNQQSLDAEQKKYKLGASTTAAVLLQQRNLSGAENNLITARAAYARDRANLSQILANTLERYGISIDDAVTGQVKQSPVIPGIEAAKQLPDVTVPSQKERLQRQEQVPPAQPVMPQQPPAHSEQTPPPPQ